MAKELERMRDIRIEQRSVRASLQKREERNKELRAQITPIWTCREKDEQVQTLSKELFKGRERVKEYQRTLNPSKSICVKPIVSMTWAIVKNVNNKKKLG